MGIIFSCYSNDIVTIPEQKPFNHNYSKQNLKGFMSKQNFNVILVPYDIDFNTWALMRENLTLHANSRGATKQYPCYSIPAIIFFFASRPIST